MNYLTSTKYLIIVLIFIILIMYIYINTYDFYKFISSEYKHILNDWKFVFNEYHLRFDDNTYFKELQLKHGYLLNNNIVDKPSNTEHKIAIVTYESRNYDYIQKHNTNIQNYCDKWKYTYLFHDKCDYNVYWCKLYIVLDTLKSNKYDYVMWLDSDTIIKNNEISINSIVNKYKSDIFTTVDGISVYNAGVFIIKNTKIGISYLTDCIAKYNSGVCYNPDNSGLKGNWAGVCYEQGTMNKLIFNKYYNYTTCLSAEFVKNDYADSELKICDLDVFILHLYGSSVESRASAELRDKCFSKYV